MKNLVMMRYWIIVIEVIRTMASNDWVKEISISKEPILVKRQFGGGGGMGNAGFGGGMGGMGGQMGGGSMGGGMGNMNGMGGMGGMNGGSMGGGQMGGGPMGGMNGMGGGSMNSMGMGGMGMQGGMQGMNGNGGGGSMMGMNPSMNGAGGGMGMMGANPMAGGGFGGNGMMGGGQGMPGGQMGMGMMGPQGMAGGMNPMMGGGQGLPPGIAAAGQMPMAGGQGMGGMGGGFDSSMGGQQLMMGGNNGGLRFNPGMGAAGLGMGMGQMGGPAMGGQGMGNMMAGGGAGMMQGGFGQGNMGMMNNGMGMMGMNGGAGGLGMNGLNGMNGMMGGAGLGAMGAGGMGVNGLGGGFSHMGAGQFLARHHRWSKSDGHEEDEQELAKMNGKLAFTSVIASLKDGVEDDQDDIDGQESTSCGGCVPLDLRKITGSWTQIYGNARSLRIFYTALSASAKSLEPTKRSLYNDTSVQPSCVGFFFGRPFPRRVSDTIIGEAPLTLHFRDDGYHRPVLQYTGIVQQSLIPNQPEIDIKVTGLDLPLCLVKGGPVPAGDYDYIILMETRGQFRCRALHVLARNAEYFFQNYSSDVIQYLQDKVRAGEAEAVKIMPNPEQCEPQAQQQPIQSSTPQPDQANDDNR